MKNRLEKLKWVFVICLLLLAYPDYGQDIEKGINNLKSFQWKNLFKDGIKISGGITANHIYYQAWGIADRQVPLNFLYTGNMTVDVLGKIRMPVQFSFSNQNFNFQHPFNPGYRFGQPFNRLVLKPTYKGITLHIGTCALSFSPYTLAHRYNGIGLEYKPKKGVFYGGFMLGTLNRAARIDTAYTVRNNQPAFKRFGIGIQLGIRKQQDLAEIVVFIAKDKLNSLPYNLDVQRIYPQQNVVTSLKLAKIIAKKWLIQSELAISGITDDTRVGESTRRKTFLNSYAGLLEINQSTTYKKAIRLGIDYKGKGFTSGIEYNRIDPEYRTLGAYYFTNDLENITAKLSAQLKEGKIAISGNLGLQQDNLEKSRLQTLRRVVGMASVALQPTNKININVSYSNFTSYSNLRSSFDYLTQITPYDALDTLNFRQINQNATALMNFQLPSSSDDINKSLSFNLIWQTGADKQGTLTNGSKLYNISTNYGVHFKSQKLLIAGAMNISKSEIQQFNDLMWGPSLTITKGFGENFTSMLGILYSNASQAGKTNNNILSGRVGLNYALKQKHHLTFNVIYLDKQSFDIQRLQPSFSEFTASLGYVYKFSSKIGQKAPKF